MAGKPAAAMIHDYIKSLTKIETDQQVVNQVTWATVIKPKKKIVAPRGRGEIPYHMEEDRRNQPSTSRSRHTKSKKTPAGNKSCSQQEVNNTSQRQVDHTNFAHITPSVREVNGGWNTQSNEAIERRFRERQKQYATVNNDLSTDSSSLNKSFTTSSSETTESYKTTLQDSSELIVANKIETSEGIDDKTLDRYKKNVLMIGLLRSMNNAYPENEESCTESSSEYLDTSGSIDLENGVANLSVAENEDALRGYRLGMLFQSNEDEDVYYHPLKEQIQKDPEWQKLRLKRKGTEIIYSPREYYMNVDNDSFAFSPNSAS